MFRTRDSEESEKKWSLVSYAITIASFMAILASLVALLLIEQERRLISEIDDEAAAVLSADTLALLDREVRLQLAATAVMIASLTLGLFATWWFRRQYSTNRRALRQVKMLAHDILASMDQGVITTDREGVITSINSAATRGSWAWTSSASAAPAPASPRRRCRCRGVPPGRRAQPPGSGPRLRRRPGRPARCGSALDADVLKDPGGTPLGCVIHLRDVTERMLMEERMWRMEQFLSLGTLASGLHHEIKNPLTAPEHPRPAAGGAARADPAGRAGRRADRRAEVRGPPAQRRRSRASATSPACSA